MNQFDRLVLMVLATPVVVFVAVCVWRAAVLVYASVRINALLRKHGIEDRVGFDGKRKK